MFLLAKINFEIIVERLNPSVLFVSFIIFSFASIALFLQADLQKMRQQTQETKQFIEKQEAEERELLKIIAEAEANMIRQKRELDQVQTDKWKVSVSLRVCVSLCSSNRVFKLRMKETVI